MCKNNDLSKLTSNQGFIVYNTATATSLTNACVLTVSSSALDIVRLNVVEVKMKNAMMMCDNQLVIGRDSGTDCHDFRDSVEHQGELDIWITPANVGEHDRVILYFEGMSSSFSSSLKVCLHILLRLLLLYMKWYACKGHFHKTCGTHDSITIANISIMRLLLLHHYLPQTCSNISNEWTLYVLLSCLCSSDWLGNTP